MRNIGTSLTNRDDGLLARWYDGGNNWGDMLNPVLIEALSGRPAVRVPWPGAAPRWKRSRPGRLLADLVDPWFKMLDNAKAPIYSVVGSTLQHADRRTVVWGSGFIHEESRVLAIPRSVHAVRGPLSRQRLLQQGVVCPAVYGDPALLFPFFRERESPRRDHYLGIIPHLCDRSNPALAEWQSSPEMMVVDIGGGTQSVVDAVCRCQYIVSSSLHGLIIADACGIPNGWIVLSEGVVGGGFKFRDYFASLNIEKRPLRADRDTTIRALSQHAMKQPCAGRIDLVGLLRACPFSDASTVDEMIGRIERKQVNEGGFIEWV